MPGLRLNDTERRLRERWQRGQHGPGLPQLTGITIQGGTGLRGITDVFVPLRYPLAALCGCNGVGKTTILAAAALAFHSPVGWQVSGLPHVNRRATEDRSYFTFRDFFITAAGEAAPADVAIRWRYRTGEHESVLTFQKSGDRWGRYSSRPERAVDFLPLSRIMPAVELPGMRTAFRTGHPGALREPLTPPFLRRLSQVLDRPYDTAGVDAAGRYRLNRCFCGNEYTGFNMGGGEASMIALLRLVQRLPRGGLLIIEEVEAGLHPQAQRRLAECLLELCHERHIQIICSTHSEIFLDALPQEARLLLRKEDGVRVVDEGPTTRFAMAAMVGEALPELTLYCEDDAAEALIRNALPYEFRTRVDIRPIGSAESVVRQGVAHGRSGHANACLCILDGDKTDREIVNWMQAATGGDRRFDAACVILPGNAPPERWASDQLVHADYLESFRARLGCRLGEARDHVEAMRREENPHNIAYRLGQRTRMEKAASLEHIMAAVAPVHPGLEGVRQRVRGAFGIREQA